jgi:thymidylate synthase (FAD)
MQIPLSKLSDLRGLPINVLVSGSGPCGYVELKDWMGDEHTIADVARSGTGSLAKTELDDWRLLERLIRDEHTSPLEFCEAHFELRLPIFTLRQLFRYRTANQQEQSGRYRELPAEFYLPGAFYRQHPSNRQMSGEQLGPAVSAQVGGDMLDACVAAGVTYRDLLERGLSREQARMVLPLNTLTTCRWKTDLHNLLHFLEQRLAPSAQDEIRAYAKVIGAIVKLWLPHVWAAFREHRLDAVRLSANEAAALREMAWPAEELARGDKPFLAALKKLGVVGGNGSLPVTTNLHQLELPL